MHEAELSSIHPLPGTLSHPLWLLGSSIWARPLVNGRAWYISRPPHVPTPPMQTVCVTFLAFPPISSPFRTTTTAQLLTLRRTNYPGFWANNCFEATMQCRTH